MERIIAKATSAPIRGNEPGIVYALNHTHALFGNNNDFFRGEARARVVAQRHKV